MGFTLEEFYDLSWFEYNCLLDGYNKKQKMQWEQTLFICYSDIMGNPHIPNYQKPMDFKEFCDSMLDPEYEGWKISQDELNDVKKLWGIK